jgi:hypothetical protein
MVARVAEACNSRLCAHLLVRGDQIEFVSAEQFRRMGGLKFQKESPGPGWQHVDDDSDDGYWTPPSDIWLPRSYVLVHDTTGDLLSRCELYVVKWHRTRVNSVESMHKNDVEAARDYFSMGDAPTDTIRLETGSIVIPRGPWSKKAKIKTIRYRRHGFKRDFDHTYEPNVWLSSTERPLAWKLSLPSSCVVHEEGFVRP